MTFAHPVILLALLVLPLVALLYVRRAGKRETAVPSLLLWRAAAAEPAAEAGKRAGGLDLPLLLALLFLATAIGAASAPSLLTGGTSDAHVLVIVDRSASMATRVDGDATRLERSIGDAREILGELDGGSVTLIGLPLAVGPALSDLTPAEARSRLKDLPPTDMPLDLVAGLSRSAGFARNASAVLVLTDDPEIVPRTLGGTPVFTISHGGPSRNVAIDAFEVTLGKDYHLDLFIAVKNHSKTGVTGGLVFGYGLELRLRDGDERTLLANTPRDDHKKLSVEPGATATFTISGALAELTGSGWANSGRGPKRIGLRLDTQDDLAADNHAFFPAHPPLSHELHVAYVGRGNPFITRALGLLPGVAVSQFRLTTDVQGDFDLTVYDGTMPDKLPAGDVVLIDPVGTVGPITARAGTTHPAGLRVSRVRESPLLKDVDVGALRFTRLASVQAVGAEPLIQATGGKGVALMRWSDDKTTAIILGCDLVLSETNWPQLPSFPIFWSNVIEDAAGRRGSRAPTWSLTGEHIAVRGSADEAASVRGPDGEDVPLIAGRGARSYFLPTEAGVYTVTAGKTVTSHAVNMMHPGESANAGTPSALTREARESILRSGRAAGVALQRPLAIAALVLALAYWVAGRR